MEATPRQVEQTQEHRHVLAAAGALEDAVVEVEEDALDRVDVRTSVCSVACRFDITSAEGAPLPSTSATRKRWVEGDSSMKS